MPRVEDVSLARGAAQPEEHEASGGAKDGGSPGRQPARRFPRFPRRRQDLIAPGGTDKPPRQGFFHFWRTPSPKAALKSNSHRRRRRPGETSLSISLIEALEEKASDADVQALLDAHPEAANQVDCDGWLPIHLAAAFQATEFVVQALLDAHPEGAKQEGSDGWLPIHLAAAFQASDAVVKALLVANPSGAEGEGSGGWLPIHLAAALQSAGGADKEADLVLLAANPMGAKEKDCDGRLPLHYAAWTGASDAVVRALLAAHPDGAKEKDCTGRLPLNFALENKASDSVVQALLAVYPLDALYADDPFASLYKNGKLLLPCDVDVACVVQEEVFAALAQAQISLLADIEARPRLAEFLKVTESGERSEDWRRRKEIGRQAGLAPIHQKRGDALGEGGEEISTTPSSLEIRVSGDKVSPGRRVTPPHPMPHLPHTMPHWTHAPLEANEATTRRIEFNLSV